MSSVESDERSEQPGEATSAPAAASTSGEGPFPLLLAGTWRAGDLLAFLLRESIARSLTARRARVAFELAAASGRDGRTLGAAAAEELLTGEAEAASDESELPSSGAEAVSASGVCSRAGLVFTPSACSFRIVRSRRSRPIFLMRLSQSAFTLVRAAFFILLEYFRLLSSDL